MPETEIATFKRAFFSRAYGGGWWSEPPGVIRWLGLKILPFLKIKALNRPLTLSQTCFNMRIGMVSICSSCAYCRITTVFRLITAPLQLGIKLLGYNSMESKCIFHCNKSCLCILKENTTP